MLQKLGWEMGMAMVLGCRSSARRAKGGEEHTDASFPCWAVLQGLKWKTSSKQHDIIIGNLRPEKKRRTHTCSAEIISNLPCLSSETAFCHLPLAHYPPHP